MRPTPLWFVEREPAASVNRAASWHFHPPCFRQCGLVVTRNSAAIHSVAKQYIAFFLVGIQGSPPKPFTLAIKRTSAGRKLVPFDSELVRCLFVRMLKAICARRTDWVTPIVDTSVLLLYFVSGVQGAIASELCWVQPFSISTNLMSGRRLILGSGRHELEQYSQSENIRHRHRSPGMRAHSSFPSEDLSGAEIGAIDTHLGGHAQYAIEWKEERRLSKILRVPAKRVCRKQWVTIAEEGASYHSIASIPATEPDA